MAIQTGSLSSAEHDYFATKSGLPNKAPLNDHKRAVMEAYEGFEPAERKTISQLEREWLERAYNDLIGGSIANNTSIGELWKLVTGAAIPGYVVGNKTVEQVKFEFFNYNSPLP